MNSIRKTDTGTDTNGQPMLGELALMPLMSVEEYLEFELSSHERHEYVNGHLFAMVGANRRHIRIVQKLTRRLSDAAEGTTCDVFSSDLKVRISERRFYYPDIIVTCDPTDNNEYWSDKPCLIVEVLSPSTEHIDRREKLVAYQSLASLKGYLLLHQDRMRAELYQQSDERQWWHVEVTGAADLAIPCPPVMIRLDEIY